MNNYRQPRNLLIQLCIIAALGMWPLQGPHAADGEEQALDETAAAATPDVAETEEAMTDVDGIEQATPDVAATDETAPDAAATEEATPGATATEEAAADVTDTDATPTSETLADDDGSGLTPPVDTTDPSVPTTDAAAATGENGDETDAGLGLTVPVDPADQASPTGDKVAGDAAKAQLAWENFAPPPDEKFDWIQLDSGEWLKGELKSLYEFELEFESDELNTLKFDWDDIIQVRTARFQAVRYAAPGGEDAPRTIYGLLTILGEKATIGSGADAAVIERSYIISIAKGAERERDRWTGRLSIGINVRTGNSDLSDSTIQARAERRRAISRYVADYFGNFSSAADVETSNNHRLTTYYDVFKSANFYWRQGYLQYVRDKFRNIEHQANLNTGIGYSIVRSAKKDWDVTASLGALYTRFVSVEPGSELENLSPSVGLGTRYDQEVTSWLDFLFDYNLQIVDEDNGTALHHLLTKVSTEFIKDFDLEVSLVWDRVRDPQPAADGTVPSQDDFQMIFGIAYEF